MPTGYAYGENAPTDKCPYCGAKCDADFCDIGVGYQQVGPYHCIHCQASEIGPNDEPRELTKQEEDCGWYAPASEPGSSANVIGGKIVSHRAMKKTYQDEFAGNVLWHDKAYVEKWWSNTRKFKP